MVYENCVYGSTRDIALAAFFRSIRGAGPLEWAGSSGENLRNSPSSARYWSEMPGGKKTIVDVRVKDLEKWRYPSKHYVRVMVGLG